MGESGNLFSWHCTCTCKHLYHCSLLELSKKRWILSLTIVFILLLNIFYCFLTLKLMRFYIFMCLFFIILYFVDTFSVVFFNSPSQVSFFPLIIFADFSLYLHLVILKVNIWVYIQINLHGYIFKCAYKLYE